MNSISEFLSYWTVKGLAWIIRAMPLSAALSFGKYIGRLIYFVDQRHRNIAYNNLKIAFAKEKTPQEIKNITRQTFENYAQNFIDLLRLPLLTKEKLREQVEVQGEEYINEALKGGKGLIFLAMHFGSWELANMWSAMHGHSYKVLVKPQTKYSRLGELLNQYRQCGGAVVVERGMATRELLKSLKANQIVALVVDQGGREGALVPFFEKTASLSDGGIRMALKWEVPICFTVIMRTKDGRRHRLVIHPPMKLKPSGDIDKDVNETLTQITGWMQDYIKKFPSEYMWFYRVWKYSKDIKMILLSDGRTGHLRQSQAVAAAAKEVIDSRGGQGQVNHLEIVFKSRWQGFFLGLTAPLAHLLGSWARLKLLQGCLTAESYALIVSCKPDMIITTGSSLAAVNFLLAKEHDAKAIVILKPGLLSPGNFDLVFLPFHDAGKKPWPRQVRITQGAPNVINDRFIQQQAEGLVKRFSHLRSASGYKIGVLLGGDTHDFVLKEQKVRILINELMALAQEAGVEILLTTSRRTSGKVENLLMRDLKKFNRCRLLVIANRENIPEAIGGIIGLCDVLIVSGDSISMVSEAASSGKQVISFGVDLVNGSDFGKTKHGQFIDRLNSQGYILSSDVKNIKNSVYQVMRNKVQTRRLDDEKIITESLQSVI